MKKGEGLSLYGGGINMDEGDKGDGEGLSLYGGELTWMKGIKGMVKDCRSTVGN